MKDPCDDLRDWLYTSLNGFLTYGGSTVPIYSFPDKNATMPYVVIGEHSGEAEMGAKDTFMWDIATMLEIFTSFPYTVASYIPVNNISSQVMQLLRQRAYGGYGIEEGNTPMNNFNVVRVQIGGMSTDREIRDTDIIISKTISINVLMEEL